MKKQFYAMAFVLLVISLFSCQKPGKIDHYIVAAEKDYFYGWPANNGVWQWGDEILVGFTRGNFSVKSGHNISGRQESLLARSVNGGKTWEVIDPSDFMDDENEKFIPDNKSYFENPLDFHHNGFALRVFASGYHGNEDTQGGFYYTYDRGNTWQGPYYFGDINDHSEIKDKIITARTDYIITGKHQAYFFFSANPKEKVKANRIGCLKTVDGGLSFKFLSWITPQVDDINTVMSSTVRISDDKFVLTYRKIYHENIESLADKTLQRQKRNNAIEVMVSEDACLTWNFLSSVKTMESDSNPPALNVLKDGRLVCIYGDRHNLLLAGKYSKDEGKTWGEEFTIRENTAGSSDFGYPRLVQRKDGKLVAIYYWSSPENVQEHIAASIWDPKVVIQ